MGFLQTLSKMLAAMLQIADDLKAIREDQVVIKNDLAQVNKNLLLIDKDLKDIDKPATGGTPVAFRMKFKTNN